MISSSSYAWCRHVPSGSKSCHNHGADSPHVPGSSSAIAPYVEMWRVEKSRRMDGLSRTRPSPQQALSARLISSHPISLPKRCIFDVPSRPAVRSESGRRDATKVPAVWQRVKRQKYLCEVRYRNGLMCDGGGRLKRCRVSGRLLRDLQSSIFCLANAHPTRT